MFTGLIEALGTIEKIEEKGNNKTFTIKSPISDELDIDQSVSHNGVCLTVTAVNEGNHRLTAVEETLNRSNLNFLEKGSNVNLERCLLPTQRLDGHIVQGHVDDMGEIKQIEERNGSTLFTIEFDPKHAHLLIEKGSIAVDGVSLTIVSCDKDSFQVTIIPHTSENTLFGNYSIGTRVNLEFDIVGKYLSRYKQLQEE